MKIKHTFALYFLITLTIVLATILYNYGIDSDVLDPKGIIALKERDLMFFATLLMLIVVIPVLLLTFAICVKFSANNKNSDAEYAPEWDHDLFAESVWWGFPFIIILILSIVTWKSSHELDPYKPLSSSVKPLVIQVVALQWKWLFLYPEQGIATVNFIQVPEHTPLNFEITADAPMNSFWIPKLGGQIYAMPGMNTKLHLIADHPGIFKGSSANLSGDGFAGMTFNLKSASLDEFKKWVQSIKEKSNSLDLSEYEKLQKPSAYNPEAFYTLKAEGLYNYIVMKYMMPKQGNESHD